MFLLPNHKKIDEDGVIDAMLDTDMSRRYFLDTLTGEVGCVEKGGKKKAAPDPGRYLEVARISVAAQLRWMKKFTEFCVEDPVVAKVLLAEMKKENAEKAFSRCEELLRADPNKFMYGWKEWQRQSGFEEMLEWFSTLPIDIEDKFEGCGDCELCKLMERGEHNLGDFLEAKQKEERKKNSND